MVDAPDDTWSLRRHWSDFASSITADITGFSWESERIRRAIATGLAVVMAMLAAICLDLDYPMWSAMTAFTVTQGSVVATGIKSLLRTAGTIIGALLGALLIGFIADSHFELVIALFVTMTWGLYRSYLSRWFYAWLLGTITVGLMLLATMADASSGLHAGAYRAAEIIIGCVAAWLTGWVLLPPATDPHKDRALIDPPKLSSRRAAAWAAVEGGLGIVAVTVLYQLFDLPGFASSTVSMTRIADPDPQIGSHRGFLRVIGCCVGMATGLAAVWLAIDWLPAILLVVFVTCAVFGYFGSGSAGSAYAGMQAAFAFLLAFVEGSGPATSLDPAIDRMAGVLLAVLVFWAIDVIIGGARSAPSQLR